VPSAEDPLRNPRLEPIGFGKSQVSLNFGLLRLVKHGKELDCCVSRLPALRLLYLQDCESSGAQLAKREGQHRRGSKSRRFGEQCALLLAGKELALFESVTSGRQTQCLAGSRK
jgi:hypothetical protein